MPQEATPKGWSFNYSAYSQQIILKDQNQHSSYPQRQALRLGLLEGQALEQSDNPVKTYPQRQLLRVGLSTTLHIAGRLY